MGLQNRVVRPRICTRLATPPATLVAFILGIAAFGCSGEAPRSEGGNSESLSSGAEPAAVREASQTNEAPSAGQDGGHAKAGFVPGSYEDWCGGHGVPESQCTRCNSSLIPAFQAVGDWCAEHGLPESQCLACNPDLVIERPARSEGQ